MSYIHSNGPDRLEYSDAGYVIERDDEHYTKEYIDNNFYNKTESDSRFLNKIRQITDDGFISIPNESGSSRNFTVTGLPTSKYKCDVQVLIISDSGETDNNYLHIQHRCSGSGSVHAQDPINYYNTHKDSSTSPPNLKHFKTGGINDYTYYFSYSCITDETDNLEFKTVLIDNGALGSGTITLSVRCYSRILIQPVDTF